MIARDICRWWGRGICLPPRKYLVRASSYSTACGIWLAAIFCMWAVLLWKVTYKYLYSRMSISANLTVGGLRFLVNKTAADFDGEILKPEYMHHVATFDEDSVLRVTEYRSHSPRSRSHQLIRLRERTHDGIHRLSWQKTRADLEYFLAEYRFQTPWYRITRSRSLLEKSGEKGRTEWTAAFPHLSPTPIVLTRALFYSPYRRRFQCQWKLLIRCAY